MAVQPYQAGTNGGTGVLSSTSGYGAKYGELSAADAFTIQKKFLAISKQLITMARFAQKDTKPLNEGRDIRFRRYERFAVNTTEISEGVTPTSDSLQQTTIKATLAQYGAWVPVTDVMLALSTDPIVAQITERQAIQMAEQMDTLAYNKFKATSSVFYQDGSTFDGGFSAVNKAIGGNTAYVAPGGTGTDAKILAAVVRFLEKNNAQEEPANDTVDALAVKILAEKFNTRYGKLLNEEQQKIIRTYIFSMKENNSDIILNHLKEFM